jgi:hypothetical protein
MGGIAAYAVETNYCSYLPYSFSVCPVSGLMTRIVSSYQTFASILHRRTAEKYLL